MKKFILIFLVMIILLSLFVGVATASRKTEVCHRPGTQNQRTVEATAKAAISHISHGDYYGPCVESMLEAP